MKLVLSFVNKAHRIRRMQKKLISLVCHQISIHYNDLVTVYSILDVRIVSHF